MGHLVRPQLLVRILGGHHHEVAVLFQPGQRIPGGVHHQGIAGLERHVADAVPLAIGLPLPVQGHEGDTVGLAHPDVPGALPNEAGAGRNHHLGDAGLGGGEGIGKGLQVITENKAVFFDEGLQVRRRSNDAENGAGIDAHVAGHGAGTDAQVVGTPEHGDDTDPLRPFDVVQGLAHQRTFGRHHHLVEPVIDAVHLAEILHGVGTHGRLLVAGGRQHVAAGKDEIDDARGHQGQANWRHREQAPWLHGCHALGSQHLVGVQDQVVEQDQGAGTHHGDGPAQDGTEAHGHEQA